MRAVLLLLLFPSLVLTIGCQPPTTIPDPPLVEIRECAADEIVQLRGLYNDPAIVATAPCGVTNDIDTDITALVEKAQTSAACPNYWLLVDPATGKLPNELAGDSYPLALMLLCGKHSFFHIAVPAKGPAMPSVALDLVAQNFKALAGEQFVNFGFIPQPGEKYPVGLSEDLSGYFDIFLLGRKMTITCAGCHTSQLADGRYAVGAANNDFDMGAFYSLVNFMLWKADPEQGNLNKWPQEIVDHFQTVLEPALALSDAPTKGILQNFDLMPESLREIVVQLAPPASAEEYRGLVKAQPGRFNVYMPLISWNDRQFFMSTPNIWNMRKYEEDVLAGIDSPAATVALNFSVEELVELGYYLSYQSAEYVDPRYVDPVASYIRTLKTPKNLQQHDAALVDEGLVLFNQHCKTCHDGDRGESLLSYPMAQMGTPANFESPFVNYQAPYPFNQAAYDYMSGNFYSYSQPRTDINARSLRGIWTRKQLMANGGVRDLQHLFCLDEPRGPVNRQDPLTDAVHLDLCSDYDQSQKLALLEFLQSWD